MKLFYFVAFAMVVVCAEGNKDMMMKVLQDCQKTVGATDADVSTLVVHKPPENQAQMCLISCIMESFNVMKAGKLQKDGLIEMVKHITNGDPVKMKFGEELYDECEGMGGGGTDCESASKIMECVRKNGMKKAVLLEI